ncbi:citrulline utilization hydrolase CtlX [Flocculibacter collagenilyticus]|uniref:citrulline utilization hydrolase CtlX n=1 Tax=Flocculibacter collagenilyticus TaxID=2744479 RepID=UPI0018F3CCD0|nr:arginine deiminase-related protein [Flocculibacter collagenilyticus]
MSIVTSPAHQPQCTNTVLMVRPTDFSFNSETATDNEFQNKPALGQENAITQLALQEFEGMVKLLRSHGIHVIVMDKQDLLRTPDAVFPNNWFSTTASGGIHLYPMKAENRRLERRYNQLTQLLVNHDKTISHVTFIGLPEESKRVLEGTGVLIFDHKHATVYAALSERCDPIQLANYAKLNGHTVVAFETASANGKPIYHTNVMLSIGERFCVVCDEVITTEFRGKVLEQLAKRKQVITISEQQMSQFCANILQVKNATDKDFIVMSETAYNAFTDAQKAQLSQFGELLPVAIPTIESVGGGSARCMLAEIFLPHC